MRFPGFVVISEGALAVFLGVTWYRILGLRQARDSWRGKASLLGLVLPTIALAVELLLVTAAHFRLLEGLDVASPGGEWAVFGARLWLVFLLSAGLLSFCGLIFAAVGKGSPRVAAVVWSFLVLGSFFGNLVLAVKFFH